MPADTSARRVVSWFVLASSRLFISIERQRRGNHVQAWVVKVLFTYPLVGCVAARVGMSLVLAMLVIVAMLTIVTMLMVFVGVRVGVVVHRGEYLICRLRNERCSGS